MLVLVILGFVRNDVRSRSNGSVRSSVSVVRRGVVVSVMLGRMVWKMILLRRWFVMSFVIIDMRRLFVLVVLISSLKV